MKLYFRVLVAAVRALLRRRRRALLEEGVLLFRVWPTDLDFNRHLNNARYLALMDIGRLDLIAGLGVVRRLTRHRWSPVVGAVMLRFRRSLDPWSRFTLSTRLVAWDEKWFYVEQRFEAEGGLYALGLVRFVFRGPNGSVPPRQVLEALDCSTASPGLPAVFVAWRETLAVAAAEGSTRGALRTA